MTPRERILTALKRQTPDRPPTFEWFIDESIGQALTGSTDPIDIVERLNIDAINIRADYAKKLIDESTISDEWGTVRKLTGDCIPAITVSPIADITKQAEYQFPDPEAPHRFATLERAVKRFDVFRGIVLNLRDGFSDMRDLLGYENALMGMLLEPDHFSALLRRSIDYNLRLAELAKSRFGCDIVATTDDVANADGMLLRPETYFQMIAPEFKRVIAGYKELGYTCIKHCDGNVDAVIDFWIESGIDCLDPIDPAGGYTLGDMKSQYGDRICLKGNVDCTGALCTGTPEEVRQEVRSCIDGGGPDGLIVSSSNTIHRGVKPENYAAMLEELGIPTER